MKLEKCELNVKSLLMCLCLQLRLEEKSRENASLTRQLENALSDIRRQTEQTRDKALQKVN